jgi:hypothetical protein
MLKIPATPAAYVSVKMFKEAPNEFRDLVCRSSTDTASQGRRMVRQRVCQVYQQPFWPGISRPPSRDVPTIDLVVEYNKGNAAPILNLFLSRIDDLIAGVEQSAPAVKP